MSEIFGLDFGTSNSTLSVNDSGIIRLIDIDNYANNKETFKSIIYHNPEEKKFYYGQQAVDLYIENDAYGRYIQSIKSFLPDSSFNLTEVGGRTFKLEEIICLLLRTIKELGEASVQKNVDRVVMGRPAVFSRDSDNESLAVKRLLSAAKLAGFHEVYLQYEPIAAALAFEGTLPEEHERIVLVGDFGGGTSDFTVIKTKGGKKNNNSDRKEDILGLNGVYVGGDTFDSQLMWEKIAPYFGRHARVKALMGDFDLPVPSTILKNLRKWHMIPHLRLPQIRQHIKEIKLRSDKPGLIENLENLIEDNYGYILFRSIEKSKCELSSLFETIITFKDLSLEIGERVIREEFEKIIQNELLEIDSCVEEVMKQAGLKNDDIDVVFLTGGSSHIPKIKQIFVEKFGGHKIDQTNAFTSVAYGLGMNGQLYL